jgi:acyl carrier protein
MIHSRFQLLPLLPLNRIGKINRSALPSPLTAKGQAPSQAAAPEHDIEVELVDIVSGICAELLRLPSLGSQDNLLDYGLHSLVALQITNRLNQHFCIRLPAPLPLHYPIVAELAAAIENYIVADLS